MACNQDILNSCLWYNSHISKDMFYSNCYQKGILTVDVVESDGQLLSISVLRHRFNLNINLLNYYTVRSNVSTFIKKYKNCTFPCKLLQVRQYLSFRANILFGIKTKSNSFHRSLIQVEHQREFPTHELKWISLLNYLIDNDNWNIYYKVCFWTIKENSLYYICGDFNIHVDLPVDDSYKFMNFLDLCDLKRLINLLNQPTNQDKKRYLCVHWH